MLQYLEIRVVLTQDQQEEDLNMSKSIFVAGLLLLTSACSSHNSGVGASSEVLASNKLSGNEFCRIIDTGGMFGQPRGKGEHCVKFLDANKVKDNANTFFGNPPETGTYSVAGKTITLSFENEKIYVLSSDGESIRDLEGKQVLTLKSAKKSLAKKEFCRIVETGGILGQPRGKGEHCVKFLDAREVVDNANTFFGNPPQRGTYSLEGKTITLNFEDKKIYVLSSDGLSISDLEGKQVLTLK